MGSGGCSPDDHERGNAARQGDRDGQANVRGRCIARRDAAGEPWAAPMRKVRWMDLVETEASCVLR